MGDYIYQADPTTRTGMAGQSLNTTRRGLLGIARAHSLYMREGRKFGFGHSLSIATGSEILCWVLTAGVRTVFIDHLDFGLTYSAGSQYVEYKVYVQPTLKAAGTGITVGNLLAGNATAATMTPTYTPTAGASLGTLIGVWSVPEGTATTFSGESAMSLTASTGIILITGTSSATRTGTITCWFHEEAA